MSTSSSNDMKQSYDPTQPNSLVGVYAKGSYCSEPIVVSKSDANHTPSNDKPMTSDCEPSNGPP